MLFRSLKRNVSCASCHDPDNGFGDGLRFSVGTTGDKPHRHTPHLYNLAWNVVYFWDGRATSLEEQFFGPMKAVTEMNLPMKTLIPRLEKVPFYREQFRGLFPDSGITPDNVAIAMAAFQRTLIVANTPFDRYAAGETGAIGPEAVRGLELFKGKAKCASCHDGPNLTDNSFHNIGIDNGDVGRAEVMEGETLAGAFKTPGLRNVTLTAPYMHDGSLPSLEAVVRHYNQGVKRNGKFDPNLPPLNLSEREISQLIAFLATLTEIIELRRPEVP